MKLFTLAIVATWFGSQCVSCIIIIEQQRPYLKGFFVVCLSVISKQFGYGFICTYWTSFKISAIIFNYTNINTPNVP